MAAYSNRHSRQRVSALSGNPAARPTPPFWA